MNIIVCIKQVPQSSNVKVDPETGVLIRDGVESKMNPYDLFALEAALSLKESLGAHVEVITMGPPAAKAVLMEAVYMGADHGTLISDRRLGGADVLATAYTLSSAILAFEEELGPVSLILCGKQTTDGDTAQVGPEIAEYLDLPQYSNVRRLFVPENASETPARIQIQSQLGTKLLDASIQLPALLCLDSEVNTPRLPSFNRKKALKGQEEPVRTLSLSDFQDQDESHYGLKGSATSVERIFPPEKTDTHIFIEKEGEAAAGELLQLLQSAKRI